MAGTGGHRPGIEGLRAVAVLLVAAYHIWLGRVSGGVDVFLMLTGLLVTASLLRAATGPGIGYGAFLARLAARLLPTAALVVLATLAGTRLFLPQSQWNQAPEGAVAALLGHTNWRLALDSVDYLARTGVPDPFQHFWSLSVQWQFYLLWPALIAGAVLLARRTGRDPRLPLLWVLAAVFVLSLAYSVAATRTDQPWAYFDTGARLWELALGGLVALLLPVLRLGRTARLLLGWGGLAALVLCGALLQVSTAFPGFAALWPTLAAAAVIAAGAPAGEAVGADRVLSSRPLRYLGSLSYALYLWHWPVLVFYLAATGRDLATPLGGAAVLAVSVLAAAATAPLADRLAVLGRGAGRRAALRGTAVAVACLLPALGAAGAWAQVQSAERARWDALLADGGYPGAAAADSGTATADLPIYPPVSLAAEDAPVTYADGCNQTTMDSEAIVCEYGSDRAEYTVALVGGSHAAHWFPALEAIAAENGWRLLNIVKGACLFTDAPQLYKGEPYTSCAEWNREVMAELERLRPDAVFTTGTTTSLDASAGFGEEQVVDGYAERWRELGEWGIEVVAVRDTPRFGFDVPACLSEADPADPDACTVEPGHSLAPVSPLVEAVLPANVTVLDLTDLFCGANVCRPVIGNVLVYWDGSHIGSTFMRTLAPELERRWLLTDPR